eukprot:gene33474-38919_t
MRAKEIGHTCSVGVTTGNVFCGIVGAVERRDYAGIGSDVNMAARDLLGIAEEMQLKGKDKPITPFAYLSSDVPRISAVDEVAGYGTILRRRIKAALGEQLDKISNLASSGSSNGASPKFIHDSDDTEREAEERNVYFTVISGLAGTGKSTAAQYFSHLAKKRGITSIFLQARPDMQRSPYAIMKALFLELVGLENLTYTTKLRSLLKDLIEKVYPEADSAKRQALRASLETVLDCQSSRARGSSGTISKTIIAELKEDTSPSRRALAADFADT